LPLVLLISTLDLFNSFWALFVDKSVGNYSQQIISLGIALAAPGYIFGSIFSRYLSARFGQRNAIIFYLVLQVLGSGLLYFAGVSPIFVLLYIIIPVFAQGGAWTLFTSFMQSSLKAIGKIDKADSVDAGSRSFLWFFAGAGMLAGGALAGAIGQANVIVLSTLVLTSLLVYVVARSKTLVRAQKTAEDAQKIAKGLKGKIKAQIDGVKELLKNKKVVQIMFSTMLVGVLMTAVVPIQQQFIFTGLGFSVPLIAAVLLVGSALQSLASKAASMEKFAPIRSLILKTPLRNAYWISLIGLAGIFLLTHNPIIFLTFIAAIGVFQALSATVESSYAAKTIPDEKQVELLYNIKLTADAAVSAIFVLFIAAFAGEGTTQDLGVLSKIILSTAAASFAAVLPLPLILKNFTPRKTIFKRENKSGLARFILQSA